MQANSQLNKPFSKDIPTLIMRQFMPQNHPHFLFTAFFARQNNLRMDNPGSIGETANLLIEMGMVRRIPFS